MSRLAQRAYSRGGVAATSKLAVGDHQASEHVFAVGIALQETAKMGNRFCEAACFERDRTALIEGV